MPYSKYETTKGRTLVKDSEGKVEPFDRDAMSRAGDSVKVPSARDAAAKGLFRDTMKEADTAQEPLKKAKGGAIKKYARGGGIESRGKTKGRFV